ncbi:MAG: hypothetical protein MJ248_00350 [Bacilli bacterium]|nr:hypothetical protein [Bacilli bacterium]
MGISRVKTCYNCGAILQSDDKGLAGYCNRDILENERQNFIFCDACFNQEKYQNTPNEPHVSAEMIKVLKDAKKRRCLFVYVVSMFSFECSFNKEISQLLVGCNVIAVGNKKDLLPKQLSDYQITDYLRHRFSVAGIKVKESFITSGDDENDIAKIGEAIEKYRRHKDVIVIGSASSGKKTLVLNYLKAYKNISNSNIVTDNYPGTNVPSLIIPIYDGTFIYSINGWELNNAYDYNVDSQLKKAITVNKSVVKKDVSLSKKQTLMIGGLALVEMVEGPKTNFDLYFSSSIEYLKRPSDVAVNKFIKKIQKGIVKPANKSIKSLKDLDVYEIKVSEINRRDIGIQGLGWLSFEGKNQIFRIYVPHNVAIYKSRAKI